MLRLFLLGLILTASTVSQKSEEPEGSADGDDEEDEDPAGLSSGTEELKNEERSLGNKFTGDDDGSTTIIIIAAVSVVAVAVIAIIAIVLFRRHLQNREQGVYTVPTEQTQKGAV
ncbi:uncharacterized protein si:dkey-262k9.2 [Pygocentrus nattereri]|uniref:uncharacterized protein si:dkey-262k9.2 n=1 Tax=Pygocentrus nattereri TaxID=42514 RepID=UPI0018917854|nr:uncharacterized protein si:dkey-262k9.2 [Pygocentrus nattereri]XP_037402338.1 uncharacterized protein si:dkey-262k9.2 [Pygocentrus nattereri]